MADEDSLVPFAPETPAVRTPAEQLTEQFYAWELRGRGWRHWPWPVELEPPFSPFLFHALPPPPTPLDDARKPTFLSSLVEQLTRRYAPAAPPLPTIAHDEDLAELEPEIFGWPEDLAEVQVTLPAAAKVPQEAAESLLVGLSSCSLPVAFEVVGLPGTVLLQFVCSTADRMDLREKLRAYFPEAVPSLPPESLSTRWSGVRTSESLVVDFGLSDEFTRPIKAFPRFDPVDPLIAFVGALAQVEEGEVGVLQVLFQAARAPWGESILRAVSDDEGRSFFLDAPEMLPLAREKVARPLFAAVVRVGAQSTRPGRAWQIAKGLGGALRTLARPMSNQLIPLSNDGYDDSLHETALLFRQSHRCGMLLNSEELASLVHLPSSSLRSPKLKREDRRTKAAPPATLGHRLVLGGNFHDGIGREVSLDTEHRVRHTYVIGASGTGKSTLLLNLVIQDLEQGAGFAVLDPHGDLIDEILGYVPARRFDDVVLVDPSDAGFPVGFNILQAHSELERTVLASDLVGVFRRLSTTWGDQMTSVLGNAILAFLESDRGGTLADLRRFLVEPDFRRSFLRTVKDPEVVYYWEREFPLLTGKPQAPLLTRLDIFLRPKLIRAMVVQKENRIDFASIMNEGKVLLVKLAQGAIGEENAALLGSLFVAKLQQTVLGRQAIGREARRPFYLYIDEFHHFVTPSMAELLTGARKFQLGLIVAHQELRQLVRRDPDTAHAVLANPATRIAFGVSDEDAAKLAQGLSFFTARDLQNLETGEAVCRIDRADFDFNLTTRPLPALDADLARERRAHLIALSRELYARPRVEVDRALAESRPPQVVVRERPKPSPPPAPRPPREEQRATAAAPPPPPSPGRGGPQHKYLQELVKRAAEGKGWKATIEKSILGGAGSVDVALEREGQSLACEISVTSSLEQELGNVQKCLAAGFERVALIATDERILRRAEEALASSVGEAERDRILFFTPEQVLAFLDEAAPAAPAQETVVRGYRVKVQYSPAAAGGEKARQRAISEVIVGALRRMRRQDPD